MKKTVLVALAMAIAGAAVAQNAPQPDPKDPSATVPAFTYRSAFEGYQPFVDQEVQSWRKANDEVGTAAGHKGHGPGRATGQDAPARRPSAPAVPATSAPAPQDHGGHK
jgi:hypothetical protein